jgi:signal transduction histidine kinase
VTEATPTRRVDDLQRLLSETVRGLLRRTDGDRACAWIETSDASLQSVAAHRHAGEVSEPDLADFELLCALPRATDLGEPKLDPRLARLAHVTGLSAAVPFFADRSTDDHVDHGATAVSPGSATETAQSRRAAGVLLVGGADDPLGAVRPRTLAILSEVADQLGRPLATALAIDRLGVLDGSVRRLDRLAALGDLISEIVHEIRNPLVSVKTFLQLLPDRRNDPEFYDDFREVVCEEVSRLERLLDSVLRHGGPRCDDEASTASSIPSACEAVAQLVGHRARERQIELDFQPDPSSPRVSISRDTLLQILLNLTLNALEVTPPGGAISVRTKTTGSDGAHECVADNTPGRWVDISVEDQGQGIDPPDRSRIFEPFYSTREDRPGGLGLAISQRLVEEAGGTIRVSEAGGGGARFTLRLPAAPASG